MRLQERLTTDLKEAMRSGDARRRDTIRLLLASLKNGRIATAVPLTDDKGRLHPDALKRISPVARQIVELQPPEHRGEIEDARQLEEIGKKLGLVLQQVRDALAEVQSKLGQRDLTEEEELAVVVREIKQRRDSIDAYERAGRTDLAAKEREESEILQPYGPQQLSRPEIESLVRQVIAEVGATGPRDTGKVMQRLMPAVRGKADGKEVSQIVQSLLTSQ